MKAEFKYTSDGGVAWYRLTDVVRSTIVYETISDMYRGALAALTLFRGCVREFNDRYMQPHTAMMTSSVSCKCRQK